MYIYIYIYIYISHVIGLFALPNPTGCWAGAAACDLCRALGTPYIYIYT